MSEDSAYPIPGVDPDDWLGGADAFDLDDDVAGAGVPVDLGGGGQADGTAFDLDGDLVADSVFVPVPVDVSGDGVADEYDLSMGQVVPGDGDVGDADGDGVPDEFDLDPAALGPHEHGTDGDPVDGPGHDSWADTDDDGQSLIHPPDDITQADVHQAVQDWHTQSIVGNGLDHWNG